MEGPFNVVIIFGVVFFGRCSSSEASSSLVTKTSLTTARVRDGNLIPKPTSYWRIFNVEPVNQSSSTPYDLGITDPRRRANVALDNVWDWDYWCQLQPRSGDCPHKRNRKHKIEKRYYYVAQVDLCKKFRYSGCDGNQNNFATSADCESKCKDASRLTLKETNNSIYCSLQPDVGMCFALIERYYYDVQTNRCKTFIYGGCGGNQNRFSNIELCEERCKHMY